MFSYDGNIGGAGRLVFDYWHYLDVFLDITALPVGSWSARNSSWPFDDAQACEGQASKCRGARGAVLG